jgi:DNA-binding CsgD family transcriptional regulator
MRKFVAVNDRGRRVGQDHPKAQLTDAEVERLLALREQGYGYKRLARMFDISARSVRDFCSGRTRSHLVAGFREVRMTVAEGV